MIRRQLSAFPRRKKPSRQGSPATVVETPYRSQFLRGAPASKAKHGEQGGRKSHGVRREEIFWRFAHQGLIRLSI
jgi:hypothetical protein